MMRTAFPRLALLACALLVSATARADDSGDAKKAEKERQEIRKKSQQILGKLYKAQPEAKAAIAKASGYATFSSVGTKILVAGGGSGKGVVVDNATRKETFMKMLEVQAGLGFGVKKFSLIWVFESPAALQTFVDGGTELGGQTSAAAKTEKSGGSLEGAVAVAPDTWLYQLTDKGLALEITVKGTKYRKNDDLN